MTIEVTLRKRPREEAVQTQRKFFKKTARGKVIKIIRERYLRDDVSCGIDACPKCPTDVEAVLPVHGSTGHPTYPCGHILVPDTNIFLRQMDLIESDLFNAPIIVLQTVLEEVRHRSLPLHNRLKALLRTDDKRIFVFYNEYRGDTAVFRMSEESPNDLNDRAIRKAAAWYAQHIASMKVGLRGKMPPSVVLLTDDVENRKRAETEGVPTSSVRKYTEGSPYAMQLLDLLATSDADASIAAGQQKKAIYPEYMSPLMVSAGVKSGELHQGHFSANPHNYLEGTVKVPAYSKPVLLVGRESMNRAVQGDIVAVEVFPTSEWKAPADAVVDQDAALRDDDADDSDVEDNENPGESTEHRLVNKLNGMEQPRAQKEKHPTGRIMGMIKRNWRAYVCHVDKASLASVSSTSIGAQTIFVTPTSALLPRIRLRTRQAPALLDQKILVTIDRWDVTSRYPEGHFVRALGQVGGREAEQESLLLEHGVPYAAFGRAVMDCLPKEGDSWIVPANVDPAWKNRKDLRALLICSIDPPGCQDIDDALHARSLPNGNIEAGVHIADVSHFLHPETAMDSEAAARGTTVYLVDKRIDMLPSLLGTNLCSLRPHVERLAFSAIWELTPEAEIVNVRFTKSVIASKAAFTYEEAQLRKDDSAQNDDLTKSIRLLNSLARQLKAKRMKAGALNLASPEVKIHMESAESSDPIDVKQKELMETNSLVEEFMLLANISVATKIHETFPLTAVLRRHMPPPSANFETLQNILTKRKGLKLEVFSSGALAASLDKCIDPQEPAFNTLVRIMATRCMLSAEYFCSGSVPRDTFGHYGLASPIYTHFTSPIRRYADVLAHRQLAAAIGHSPLHASLHSRDYVERTLSVVNRRHRMAQLASRASTEFYVGLALKGRMSTATDKERVQEEAYVIRAFRNGIGVFVHRLGIEGLVMFKKDMEFDPDAYTVTLPAPQGPVSVAVFDKVRVNITVETDKNTQRGKVHMTLASPVDSRNL